jgi:hypothetical protein
VHVGIEHFVPGLGVIHGGVGVAHDLVRVSVMRGAEGNADAGRREYFPACD